MTESRPTCREPFFLDCEDRRLFSIFHAPTDPPALHGGAVYFAPFAEESNRTRRMASLLGQSLSQAGTGTLLFDYSSTGDSSGEFSEATWANWVADGCAALDWLYSRINKPVAVIGLRLGAMLALECAKKAGVEIPNIVLWQPVTSGRTHFAQFLRIRLAAALSKDGDRETTKDLMARLAQGDFLDVAGYRISPALAQAIDQRSLGQLNPPAGSKLHWFEVAANDGADLLPPSQNTISTWRDGGADIDVSVVEGEQFWATLEITTAPHLLESTVAALTGTPDIAGRSAA